MPAQEIYIAPKVHDDLFHGIRQKSDLAVGIIMDNIAKDVMGLSLPVEQASGEPMTIGLCDEPTFFRAFFAAHQSRKHKNQGPIPPDLRSTIKFSRWMQNMSGQQVAEIEQDERLGVPRVKSNPAGLVLGTGNDVSPVLDYRIITNSKRPEAIRGEITFGVLWTPEDPSKKREQDISEDDITDCVVLEVERKWSDTSFEVVESINTDIDLRMIIGSSAIKRADMQFYAAANMAREQDQASLRQAARRLQKSAA